MPEKTKPSASVQNHVARVRNEPIMGVNIIMGQWHMGAWVEHSQAEIETGEADGEEL